MGAADQLAAGLAFVTDVLGDVEDAFEEHAAVAPVAHIFSHINMTYHVQRLVLRGDRPEPKRGEWLSLDEVTNANVGTGVKKCWASVYGVWGGCEVGKGKAGQPRPLKKEPAAKRAKKEPGAKKPKKEQAKATKSEAGRVTRKVRMPAMPKKEVTAEVEVVVIDD